MLDQPAPDGHPVPFDVVLLPHGEYLNQNDNPDFDADAEALAIAELFEQFGGETEVWNVKSACRDLTATANRLTEWSERPRQRSSVLIWLGHGGSNDDDIWLAVRGATGARADVEFEPAELAKYIRKEHGRRRDPSDWTIVVVEACSAAAFVVRLGAELDPKRADNGILLIGSGEDHGIGYLSRFRRALSDALASYEPNHTVVRLNDLATRIDDRLMPGKIRSLSLADSRPLVRPSRLPSIRTSVEAYSRLAEVVEGLPEHERMHFAYKGMAADLGEVAWHFVGRDRERSRLGSWLDDSTHGLLVVAGPMGSGKSAILGNLLLHSHPEVADVLSQAGFPSGSWPTGSTLPTIDASVHLAGATAQDVTTILASAAGVRLPLAATDQRWADLIVGLRDVGGQGRFTVLADALDEARVPTAVAAMLNELGTIPGIRVVVGARTAGPDVGALLDSPTPDLLRQLGQGQEHVTTLDVSPDVAALATFARQRLAGTDHRDDTFGRAVDMITQPDPVTGTARTFLYASLAVHEILADPTLLSAGRADELATLLGSNQAGLFGAAVDRLAREIPVARPVLTALAHAQGRGLPMADRTWSTAATALYGRPVTDEDLLLVLDTAAPYVLLDVEDGQSVYRLVHDAFRGFLLSAAAPVEPGATAPGTLVAMALLDMAASCGPALNPYYVRHLPGHMAAAGAAGWRSLAERRDVLDRLDPHAVASYAMRDGDLVDLPDSIAGTIATAHLADEASAADRRGLREIGTARTIGSISSGDQDSDPVTAWGLGWAMMRQHPLHLTLAGHPGPVRTMSAFTVGNRTLLATGSDDGLVRIWDPITGRMTGQAPMIHSGPILALAAIGGAIDGVIASSGRDNRIQVWNSSTGRPVCDDIRTEEPITTLCLVADVGQPIVLAGGSWSGMIRMWDVTDGGAPRSSYSEHHEGAVHAIMTWVDTRSNTMLVSAGDDQMVHFWHHGNIVHRSSWQCPEPFRTVSVFSGPDGAPRIATAGNDLDIRIWDPVDGSLVGGPLSGHERRVRALTTTAGPRGGRVLASASDDGTVRTWDAVTGDALGAPLTGHHGPDTSIVPITNPVGRVRLATGSEDRTVRVWDCFAGVPDNDPPMPRAARVATLAALPLTSTGRNAVAIGGEDGRVAICDAVTGREVSAPWLLPDRPVRVLYAVPNVSGTHWLVAGTNTEMHVWDPTTGTTMLTFTKHIKPVRAITAFTDRDGRRLVATGGHDRTVCLWRSDTGELVAEPIPAYDGCIRAITAFTDRDGELLLAVGGDGSGVRVWHPFTGRSVGKDMNGLTGSVRALAIYTAPSGKRLLAGAGGEGTVATWDLTTREQVGPTFTKHTDWITSLAVLRRATGDLLVTGGDDHTVRIWDPDAADSRHVIPMGLPVLALASLGDDLAVGTTDGVLVLRWDRSWLDGVRR